MKKYDIVTFKDDEFTLKVRADKANETVWLTQKEISKLFDKMFLLFLDTLLIF